jgi:hypothetical protein
MNINLHIERLVLDGISVEPHQRPALKVAMESELGTLLTSNGLAPSLKNDVALRSIKAGSIEMKAENTPADLGQHIAQVVHRGISR